MDKPLNITSQLPRGFVLSAGNIPAGFGAYLEREGLAAMTSSTIDGMYFEPRVGMTTVLKAFERAGVHIEGVRRSGTAPHWQERARCAGGAMMRLHNRRSAEWLPTLPAA
jgi:hypothetical protein